MKSFLSHLKESEEKFNLGHAYEFILASAMVPKFTDRNEDGSSRELTSSSVESVMKEYFSGNRYWYVIEGDGVEDNVEFDGSGLPVYIFNSLKDSSTRSEPIVQKMIRDAITAVNGNGTLAVLANKVLKNGKEDDILVSCAGTKGQMKTKSDIDVFVNNREVRSAGFSVKYGGTKQIGQFASSDVVNSLKQGFLSFGMDVSRMGAFSTVKTEASKITGIYPNGRKDPLIDPDKKRMFSAVSVLFSEIAKKYDTKWLSSTGNAKSITNGLLFAARGTEEDVDVVKSTVSFDKRTFDAIAEGMTAYAKKGKLGWVVGTGANPKILLRAENMDLFSIRFRYDADRVGSSDTYKARFRLLVEVGKDLVRLSA